MDKAQSHDKQQREHELKCWPEFYRHLESGEKTFEARKDDRAFIAGDVLWLREWSYVNGYTGRDMRRTVTYILAGLPFMQPGYVVMGLSSPSHVAARCSVCGATDSEPCRGNCERRSSIAPQEETPRTEALRYLCRTCIPSSSEAMETALNECADMERELRSGRRQAVAMMGLLAAEKRKVEKLSAPSATATTDRPAKPYEIHQCRRKDGLCAMPNCDCPSVTTDGTATKA